MIELPINKVFLDVLREFSQEQDLTIDLQKGKYLIQLFVKKDEIGVAVDRIVCSGPAFPIKVDYEVKWEQAGLRVIINE